MAFFKRENFRPQNFTGEAMFSNFGYGLYNLDTPRFLSEQLGSLALVGGRNVWAEKGALIPQYGYYRKGELPIGYEIIGLSDDSYSASSFFIVTQGMNLEAGQTVFLFTDAEGLKQYKTTLIDFQKPLLTHKGNELILAEDETSYIFGNYYKDSEYVEIDPEAHILNYGTYYTMVVSPDDIDYYWAGKAFAIKTPLNEYYKGTVAAISVDLNGAYTVKFTAVDEDGNVAPSLTGMNSVGEKALIPVTNGEYSGFVYVTEPEPVTTTTTDPETGDVTETTERVSKTYEIIPIFMTWAMNRLYIVNIDGRIYYSAIGQANVFEEIEGAGFFEGFYNDTTNVIGIEEFANGVLITKGAGFYYMHFDDNDIVNVKKLCQIGQQFPGDHIVIRNTLYAYDSNAGSIVTAAYENYLGTLQQGNILIDATTLGSIDKGIYNSTQRKLVYSYEEEAMILYYGEALNKGIVITQGLSMFPREFAIDFHVEGYIQLGRAVIGITNEGVIFHDYKRGTTIPNISAIAEFEPICVRDSQLLCGGLLEINELYAVPYTITATNVTTSIQKVHPPINRFKEGTNLEPLLYSDYRDNIINESFELSTKWAELKSNLTRMYAPMSGRNGIALTFEFPENTSFCLNYVRIADFSKGE